MTDTTTSGGLAEAHGRDSVHDIWGERAGFHGEDGWPARIDAALAEQPDRWVQSACVMCSNGCGLDIAVKDGRIVGVRGRADDEVNRGRLGPKGLHGWMANGNPDRLTTPLVRRGGRLEPASWDEAMNLLVRVSEECIERYTAGSIGFYTSGQLFLEEYYTLGVIGKAGIGTPHMDGNTRLCTATAAAALKETFGADGQPGCYHDVDVTDCILHVGHNIAETDTVLWSRILDRRRGPRPPRLIAIDQRSTPTAVEADIHLQPRPGTNVAVLNGLINLIIEAGAVDRDFVRDRTVGFADLRETASRYPPDRVEALSGVPAAELRAAAGVLAATPSLLSTVLQGVYQSMQATAAAVQVNNLNLVRGMIGRPGCGVLQMNGQPTAQNTRECGADGDLPGFRNWDNPHHVRELAALWNVDPAKIPHWAPPTHALQIFRYVEQGSLRLLWIQATNPAVSLPDLPRIRRILASPSCFVVVQDAFLTETAQLADLVLPAAMWGEKTGCFTNVDRTVHISHKAVEPPGQARPDLEIFLDYAQRMDFRDADGEPLIKWTTAAGAFEAWKDCSRGRPCDYTGLSHAKLSGRSGIPWPCNEQSPDGQRRIYQDHVFPTALDRAESYGHDLVTGAAVTRDGYRALDPDGRAFLKPAEFQPPHEQPDSGYPLWLTTGRLVHHFHTRTKTGRSPQLQAAAPDAFVQISERDAAAHGVREGDPVLIESRRGRIEVPARIGGIADGQLFVPFHYGYWDEPARARAANELTLFEWDPVSKQPHYKYAAVRIGKAGSGQPPAPRPTAGAATSAPAERRDRTHIADYVTLLDGSERALADALKAVAEHHAEEPDIRTECHMLAAWSAQQLDALQVFIRRYGEHHHAEPCRLREAAWPKLGESGFSLVRDLHDCWLMACETHMSLVVLDQAARAARDKELQAILERIDAQNSRQRSWLLTRIKQAAPQALVVPS